MRLWIVMKNARAKRDLASTKTLSLPAGCRQNNNPERSERDDEPIQEAPHDMPPELNRGAESVETV
jgi:hypothetical protein